MGASDITEQPRGVVILGASGSIGKQTLDVIERHPEQFFLLGAVVGSNSDALEAIIAAHRGARGVVVNPKGMVPKGVLSGNDAVAELIADESCAIVVNGIVGSAGLEPTLWAIEAQRTVILANKEPLVMAGELVRARLAQSNATLLPIDSEHNAIFQCLPPAFQGLCGRVALAEEASISRVVLTGSGGAFRTRSLDTFASISVADATTHPNWSMGPKVTIDSATMMNKGLEYIEACVLFGLDADSLDVVLHPQSIVHSMVEYIDGSVLAQMASPDMRVPIANALAWPSRVSSGASMLDLAGTTLDFHVIDYTRYPCLALAIEAMAATARQRVYLNAANEIAVMAFIDQRIRFTDISTVVADSLEASVNQPALDALSLEALIECDREARIVASELVLNRIDQ